jgi:DNA-binding transcriptional regulator YhcF (GntR family)
VITLDPSGDVAPYEQVRSQLAAQIDSRELPAGHRLPTVRRLAQDLGIAANTVARAYRELEQAGLIETRGRAGTFVSGDGVEQEARAAAIAYVDRVGRLGLTPAEALDLVERMLKQRG